MSWSFQPIEAPVARELEVLSALDRTSRMPEILGTARGASDALRDVALVVVGQGSVGLAITDFAARVGVRSLALVDPGRVKLESLLTHPVHVGDVGASKVLLAGRRAKSLGPQARVEVFDGPFQALPWTALAGASFVALASDNLACEVAVSERCAELGIPLVQASVYGPTLTAQVRAISNRDAGTDPCLCCGFVRADWEELNRGTRYSCAGARGAAPEPEGTPTVSPPQLCATAAALAFTEVMNRVVGVRDPDSSVEIAFHGTSPRLLVTELKRSASCPAPHVRSALREWSGELASARVGDLVREAVGATERLDDVSFAAQGYRFVGLGFCGCLGHPRVDRFLAEGAAPERCGRCGLELAPHPMTAHAEVPARVLSPWLDRTLGELGAAAPGAVRVRHHPTSTLFSGARPAGARS